MDLKVSALRRQVKQVRGARPRTARRLLALIEVAKGRQSALVALDFETSVRTLYRWQRAYRQGGVEALEPGRSPGRRPKYIRGVTANRIREYRRRFGWGAEVIQAHLELDHGTRLSRHRIARFLKRHGLVDKRRPKRKRRHDRVVVVATPGAHTQMDVKYLDGVLPDERRCYVYSFVDHASRWRFHRAFDSFGPSETRLFIEDVLSRASFTITRLQTDNGIEFTYRYVTNPDEPLEHALDEVCRERGIRHVLIPPGEKELQGLVERSHRECDDQLCRRLRVRDLAALNRHLDEHSRWANESRRRKPLHWRTAAEHLDELAQAAEENQVPTAVAA
jgi:transposase